MFPDKLQSISLMLGIDPTFLCYFFSATNVWGLCESSIRAMQTIRKKQRQKQVNLWITWIEKKPVKELFIFKEVEEQEEIRPEFQF